VALDVTITDELKNEGLARELVNRIQNVRKSKDFDITDKIAVTVANDDRVVKAVTDYKEYIANQVLAVSIELGDVNAADSNAVELDMDGWNLLITVAKA
jgi:isoleucyl-tRNA synthetase